MSLNLIYNLPLTQRRFLELIRARRGYSLAELAVKNGLTPGSVTRNIKELLLLSECNYSLNCCTLKNKEFVKSHLRR